VRAAIRGVTDLRVRGFAATCAFGRGLDHRRGEVALVGSREWHPLLPSWSALSRSYSYQARPGSQGGQLPAAGQRRAGRRTTACRRGALPTPARWHCGRRRVPGRGGTFEPTLGVISSVMILLHHQQTGRAAEHQQSLRIAPAMSLSAMVVSAGTTAATAAASSRPASFKTGTFFLQFMAVVPFMVRMSLAGRPNTYQQAGTTQVFGGGAPPQLPQDPGQPLRQTQAGSGRWTSGSRS
jgi:hypothetical protein